MYKKVPDKKVYRLINLNPLLLISTISKEKKHNIAPIAWVCPQEIEPPRLLLCVDIGHQTFKNIKDTKKFIAAIPHISQLDIIKNVGSISGKEKDKFLEFNIKYFLEKSTGLRIPLNVIGYLICYAKKIIKIETTAIVVADIKKALVKKEAFNGERLLSEKKEGKIVHHLGKNKFISTGNKIF